MLLISGNGLPQDMQEGSMWLEKAAEQDVYLAQYFYAATWPWRCCSKHSALARNLQDGFHGDSDKAVLFKFTLSLTQIVRRP